MEEPKVAKPKKTWKRKVLCILGVFFALAVIALIITAVMQNKPLPQNIKYGIVLDAGSSHTSLYVYSWPAEKENDTGVVKQVKECKVEGNGISSYFKEPSKAGLSIEACVNRARQVIPANQHKETPIYLGATAGMRLLRLSNHTLADEVLFSVENSLHLSPFDFQGARILTGQEEGAYGWITINYLLKNFVQDSSVLSLLPNFKKTETSGALDLGGASTQITFVSDEAIQAEENSLHFRLYGKSYNVYTHSYLCYGKDQALRLQLVKNIENTINSTLLDPCFNPGYRRNTSTSELYSSPCVSQHQTLTTLMDFEITGTGDYQQCKANIQSIFNRTYCPYSRCAFNGIFQPILQGKFGAFSAYYFVMDFLKVAHEEATLDEVKERVQRHCSRPWHDVKAEFTKIKVKYLSEYCFSGVYILSLLELGYGFNEDNWKEISFLGKISGSDAGWTLGYMLNLTNMIPAELPASPPLSHGVYVGLMVFFSVLLLFILLTCWLGFRKPRCLQKGII